MTFIKGQAITGFPFLLLDANGNPITSGTVTATIVKDGGSQTALAASPSHIAGGEWKVNLSATEMNAEIIGLMFTHESAVPAHFTIKTSAAPAESSAGAVEVTLQIRDDEDEGQPDTEVWISTDADGASVVAGTKETNGDGEVTFMLDPGTYYRWAQKTGVNFTNPQQFTVT